MEKKKFNIDWVQAWFWVSIKQFFISYLSIFSAYAVLRLVGDTFKEIIYRNDILASIIITAVSIAWQGWKINKYKKVRDIGLAVGVIGIIAYVVLTLLPHEGIDISLNYTLTFAISALCVFVSIVLIFLFNFDEEVKKNQDEATSARGTTTETVGEKNIKM